jgi:CPA2 family monovalent cation:H+ antiporter-2
VPIVVGAFLAGVALARFPVDGIVRAEMAPIGDFFAAVFFTALGALVGIPSASQLLQAAVLAVLVIAVTVPLVTFVGERSGLAAKSAVEAGLLLAQTSEISLVIGLSGMLEGYIGVDTFTVIALVTLTTMLVTPFLATDAVARTLVRLQPSARAAAGDPPSGHVLLLGSGSTGMPLLEDLVLGGSDVVVVDDDPAVIAQLTTAGIRTVRGDASDSAVLRRAGADRARAITSTIRRPRDNAKLLEMAPDAHVLVRVFDSADAEWIAERGGTPVLYSEATTDAFAEWFEEERETLAQSLADRLGDDAPARPKPED